MISFKPAMQYEKLAIIALVIIIVAALTAFLVTSTDIDIFDNLFNGEDNNKPTETGLAIGDCADVDYTGSFKINGTIFDTSRINIAQENNLYDMNRTYEPLNIFLNPNGNLSVPEGYENYSSSMIQGFLEGLIGMEEGEIKTVSIPPEKAYGIWNESLASEMGMGSYPLDSPMEYIVDYNISEFSTFFSDVNITLNNTFDYGSLALGVNDTLTAIITDVTKTNLTFELIFEDGVTFTQPYFNWNLTFVANNETHFSIQTQTEIGHIFSFESFYGSIHFKVVDLNETSAKFAVNMQAPNVNFIGKH